MAKDDKVKVTFLAKFRIEELDCYYEVMARSFDFKALKGKKLFDKRKEQMKKELIERITLEIGKYIEKKLVWKRS